LTDLEIYYDNTQSPWGRLLYSMIWRQLSFAKSMKILDFGSGFGITANHLSNDNEVIAIEPNAQMIDMRFQENAYVQMHGSIELLGLIPAQSFDMILCHNILEYIDEKEQYVAALLPLLKSGGKLSLVKHNHFGRIMQRVAHDNDIETAMKILNGEPAIAQNFGEIKYYDMPVIQKWVDIYGLKIIDNLGIRAFYALHSDDSSKHNECWTEEILKLEFAAMRIEEFRNIAFYHHIILEKG
jgi:S-adenosylmethionine-dependent methyltransferase